MQSHGAHLLGACFSRSFGSHVPFVSRGEVEFQVVTLIEAHAKENDVVVIGAGVFSREIFQAVQRPMCLGFMSCFLCP